MSYPRVVLGLLDWIPALERRGISVVRDVCREDAVAVLEEYAGRGGMINNARQGE
jgi:hypothetical protein